MVPAAGSTVATAEAVLSAGVGSVSFSVTVAVLVNVPMAVVLATMVTVTLAPLASVPNVQVTVVPTCEQGVLGASPINITPVGSVSVMTTLVAGRLPTLVTVTLNVRLEP